MCFGCAEKCAQVAGARGTQEAIDRAADGFGARNFFPATKQRQFPYLFLRQVYNGPHSDIIARYHCWSSRAPFLAPHR
jgi:hypothetical protein